MSRITRIAPTPSGYLHVGNAFNAVLIWLWARQNDASILLRIDDLDHSRVRGAYVEDVFRTLDWLGIDWDLGPQTVEEFESSWSQSRRMGQYDRAIRTLEENGSVYWCNCSRSQWLALGSIGCDCNNLSTSTQPDAVLRLKTMPMIQTFSDHWVGEQSVAFSQNSMSSVVRRRDGLPSYQISSLVDDVSFGVSHIIRGVDLIESTAIQLHLSTLCGLSPFLDVQFMHHPLVRDRGGKLSKTAGSTSLKYVRESGHNKDLFYKWMSRSLGVDLVSNAAELLAVIPTVFIPSSENLGW